jgi:hypothetical protein
LTWRRIELATDRLAILPGPLHERLVGLHATLGVLSAADFPTTALGSQWEAIRADLLQLDTRHMRCPADKASDIACALLDLRAELRRWVACESDVSRWPDAPSVGDHRV